ncbi:hypothetical protein TcasGA2_TC011625 [Tribolium castaneum]|uniref:Uncharacterized protein n=1 Tax=Tribolium castaneum TaxID=7070 RepID=D6X188_TRICA|nr:hypothetical protein TcasGA2_TC011625 [Tribolium castaneum]
MSKNDIWQLKRLVWDGKRVLENQIFLFIKKKRAAAVDRGAWIVRCRRNKRDAIYRWVIKQAVALVSGPRSRRALNTCLRASRSRLWESPAPYRGWLTAASFKACLIHAAYADLIHRES